MIAIIKMSLAYATAFTSLAFSFVPESVFSQFELVPWGLLSQCGWLFSAGPQAANATIARVTLFVVVLGLLLALLSLHARLRRKMVIDGDNYSISVEYGDLLKQTDCKRVINFDECFTAHVGGRIDDVNASSICGQYLAQHPDLNIEELAEGAGVEPPTVRSKYQNKACYKPGTIIPNGDDLLMAFARLDEKGKGRFFSRDEYIKCLDQLWRELENYYSEKDVCMPILGSGTTSFDGGSGASLSQQDLLDMIILSYKLSSHKIKAPHRLRIICKRNKGFSLNQIGA